MKKEILSEQFIIHSDISMPKNFEINNNELASKILECYLTGEKFLFSKDWDKLNTYIREHIRIKYNIQLINNISWGNIYLPNEITEPYLMVDPVDLRNSPDYVLLYGIKAQDCMVKIFYNDNRRAGRTYDIKLTENKFILFPSTNRYYILNKQTETLNFIQGISYAYV
jgi:hypothetical protein